MSLFLFYVGNICCCDVAGIYTYRNYFYNIYESISSAEYRGVNNTNTQLLFGIILNYIIKYLLAIRIRDMMSGLVRDIYFEKYLIDA